MAMVRLPVRREQQRQVVRTAMLESGGAQPRCVSSNVIVSFSSLSTLTTQFELTNIGEKIWKFYFRLSSACLQYFSSKNKNRPEKEKLSRIRGGK